MTSGSASAGIVGSLAWLRRDSECEEKIWMRSCSMPWIESLFRSYIDYTAHRKTQRKSDASRGRTMVLMLWTVVKVE